MAAEPFLIRPFAERDIPPANALTNHYIQHTAIHFAAEPATDAEFGALWHERGQHPWVAGEVDGVGVGGVGGVGGVCVGYAKASLWRARAAYARTAEAGLYVHPDFHRRGLGRAMYAALIEACRAAGFHCLVGGVALPNPASVRLHESLGFTPVGTFREVGRKFDRWHDVGWWQLML